ncbi:hypothetical protein Q5752_004985 [Cryptotrichosporon argae]
MAFSFGAPAPAAAPAQPATFGAPASKPFSFAAPPLTSAAPGTSLFGQPAQPAATTGAGAGVGTGAGAGTSLFGSTTGAGMFGAPAGQAGQAQTQAQTQPQTQTGGLFGQPATSAPAAPAGGLFGSTAAPQQPVGGLFDGTAMANTAQSAGGLFGSTQQPAGGLFGSTATAMTGAKPGGLFSAPAQQPGLFGASTFGATQQQPQLQQQQQQQALGASALGVSALGVSALGAPQPRLDDIEGRMGAVQRAWDPSHPDCRFKYFFYNVVDPAAVGQYGRPAGATDDAKWARAVRDNPDPSCMVPVLATGWADIKKRVQAQEQVASVHQERVKELTAAITTLSRQASLSSSVRLAALQAQLAHLAQRLLHLAAQAPRFAVTSPALRPEEGETRDTLERVQAELEGRRRAATTPGLGPGHGHGHGYGHGQGNGTGAQRKGRMIGQVNELWGLLEEVRRRSRARADAGWVADENVLTNIAAVLEQQQDALAKLSALGTDALFDADVIRHGLEKM